MKKFKRNYDISIPGLYYDDVADIFLKKSKRRDTSRIRMPTGQLQDYERLVARISQKRQAIQDRKFEQARPKVGKVTKEELIDKLVTKLQIDLESKEKDIFEVSPESKTQRDELIHKKIQFFHDRNKLNMLEQMKDRILSQVHIDLPVMATTKSSKSTKPQDSKRNTIEMKLYEQQIKEYNQRESKLKERIQQNVNRELNRMGLVSDKLKFNDSNMSKSPSNNLTPERKVSIRKISRNGHSTCPNSIYETSLIQSNTKYSCGSLIQDIDQERSQLSSLDQHFSKTRQIQFKRFRGIKNDLEAIGYYGFQKQ